MALPTRTVKIELALHHPQSFLTFDDILNYCNVKRTTFHTLIASLLLLGIHITLSAQQQFSTPEIFNEINGLPNSEVICLLKDTKGYLWVGTAYGLAKYDGNKFSIFKHQSNRNSISGDVINSIFEDNQGNILVGANGLSILNRQSGLWQNFLHDPHSKFSISNPLVTSITQENDSIYWLITGNGLNRFNIKTKHFHRIDINISSRIAKSEIHQIIPEKLIIFSVGTNVYSFNIATGKVDDLPIAQGYTSSKMVNNNLIAIKSNEPNKYDLVQLNLSSNHEKILFKDVNINGLTLLSNESLYFINREKIFFFDSNFNITRTIVLQQRREIQNIEYTCALREDNGIFWVGTTRGLQKISSNSPFQFFDIRSGLPNEYVRSLMVDSKNNLWIGVRQGPAFKIESIDDYLKFRIPRLTPIKFPTADGEVFATNRIVELSTGDILFVTNKSIFLYNPRIKQFTDQFQIPNNRQYFSAVEVDDGVLVGSLDKPTLFKIKIGNGKISLDKTFQIDTYPDVVYSLFRDSNNDIWIGGEGLFKLTRQSNSKAFKLEQAIAAINDTNYSSNSIWSFLEMDSSRLFVSTTNNGFYIYNKATGTSKHFNKADGLPTDFTCTVLKTDNNNLWLSTKEGISLIDAGNFTFKNFPVKNGRYNSDFTFNSGATTKGQMILFGSKQGIVFFNPDSVKNRGIGLPPYVNEFRVFDRVVKRELTHGDTITLKHNQNFFSFEFSLLDFRNPQEIKYTFQLLRYDKAEREAINNINAVSYTNVKPGRYTFRLTSRPSWDTSNIQTVDIRVIIKPAFYQTSWFKALIYITATLLLASIIISIVRRQILHGRLQKMELNLLRSQINPHFIFNTLTSIQHTILTSSKEEAVETLSRFSRLMRMFLDYSRLEYIPLDKAILFYNTFVTVHSVNLEEPIDFHVDIDSRINPEKVTISPMLIQPFLENAIVHGLSPKGKEMKLTLKIELADSWLLCHIQDNGIGRKKAQEISQRKTLAHKSMGIEISSKSILLQLKKGKFIKETFDIVDNTDSSGNPTGTTVHLKIPYRLQTNEAKP